MKIIRILTLMIFLSVSPLYAHDPCGHVDMKWLASQAPLPDESKIIHREKRDNLCEAVVLMGGNLIPFYCGSNYVITGQFIKNKEFLTQNTLNDLKPLADKARKEKDLRNEEEEKKRREFLKKNLSELDEMVSFGIGPEKTKKSIFFITDPECSHCKHMMGELETLAHSHNLSVKCIIYPILGENSVNLAHKAICSNYDYKKYRNISDDSGQYFCEKADKLIKKEKEFFKKAELSFVPLIVSAKGDWTVEGDDMVQLRKNLGIK